MKINYIDPGTGSMLISAIIAMLSVAFFILKGFIYRTFGLGGDKGEVVDTSQKYGVVFYSEGKQYWNVFKPLVEGCSSDGIAATYFTSDKRDPGLEKRIPGIEAVYIGSGKEAFFILNRLRADLVITTTPGLDVLEIKRSPHVKHYSHITHATSSIAGYKSYGVDYFDSVLIGGTGDRDVIRELENVRKLPRKQVEIIGYTYLDEYRKKIQDIKIEFNLFSNTKTTILISPTWGNHGLLTKYGDKLLSALECLNKYNVIVRPHPQSFSSDRDLMDKLMIKYPNSENRLWDIERENLKAMYHADIMISDFSGIIFDFYSLYNKPILTINSQYEKRGRDAMDLTEDPWDLQLLDKIGRTIYEKDINDIDMIIQSVLATHKGSEEQFAELDLFPRESTYRGMRFIKNTIAELGISKEEIPINLKQDEEKELLSNSSLKQIQWVKAMLLNSNTILQMVMGSVILSILTFSASKLLLKEGLNQIYFMRLFPYTIILITFLSFILLSIVWFKNKGRIIYQKNFEKIQFINTLFTLIPLASIIQYILSNQDILALRNSVYIFIYFFAISFMLIIILPFVLSPIISTNITIPISTAFLFTLFNMASYGKRFSLTQITLILVGITILMFFFLIFDKKKLLIIVSVITFMANATTSAFGMKNVTSDKNTEVVIEDNKVLGLLQNRKPLKQPNVYILIYDSYSNEETLKRYGFDNSEQMEYLLTKDFSIYDGTYSIGPASLVSMSHFLHLEQIRATNDEYRRYISEDGATLQVFKDNGYITKTATDSDYNTTGTNPRYDVVYPSKKDSIAPHNIIIDAVKEGEFRFDANFSNITYEDFLRAKSDMLSKDEERPVFIYIHDNKPGHSQNSGVLRPNETEIHIEALVKSNEEMKKNIELIREKDNNSIIVIAGDHGPYLTKNGISLEDQYELSEVNRLDIQDRYGAFLAISWPEKEFSSKYKIQTVQDTMPAILSYMYDDDSLFDKLKMDSEILWKDIIGGASVKEGMIIGGINDGESLFELNQVRTKE